MFPQSTVLDPIFWMLLGAAQLFIFYAARLWAQDYQMNMNFWKWAAVAGWWFSFLLTLAGGFVLLGEREGNAGWYFLIFVGTFLIVGGAGLFSLLLKLRSRASPVR